MGLAAEKYMLVQALACIMNLDRRETAHLFLEGLSTDELQYIAAFLGTRLLNPALGISEASRDRLARLIAQYEWSRQPYRMTGAAGESNVVCSDISHKMILLLEYLNISPIVYGPTAWTIGEGST